MALTPNAEDQRCSHVDRDTGEQCITILCRYDEGPECYAHSPQARIAERKQREQLCRQRANRALDDHDLARLMQQDDQRIAA